MLLYCNHRDWDTDELSWSCWLHTLMDLLKSTANVEAFLPLSIAVMATLSARNHTLPT